MITALISSLTRDELTRYVDACQTPVVRTIREFAEAELVIPEGKHKDTLWRPDTLPYAGLLLDAMSTGRWPRTSLVGCVQGGKSLHGFVLPTMYHIFEIEETAILGAPTIAPVGKDKWNNEILPAIRASRYKHLLPRDGSGSRGGWAEEIQFRHGPRLKFMSAAGGDATVSSYTARALMVTEADKMDTAGETSREADPITQMENRLASYDAPERRVYIECTVSIVEGRIWQEYLAGTQSRIACPCPHCGEHVTPAREHLAGWQDAETKIAAGREANFICPLCEQPIDDAQRAEMNRRGVLLHHGQAVARDGLITGEPPETDTLSFWWNTFNNLFWSTATIAQKEWEGRRAEDDENAEKELCQFYWVIPYKSPDVDLSGVDYKVIERRIGKWPQGTVPDDTLYLTAGVDIGKWLGHWVIIAWRGDGSSHIVDYGVIEIDSDHQTIDRATLTALHEFHDRVIDGWTRENGTPMVPDQVWVDSAWSESQQAVYQFCREHAPRGKAGRYQPTKGYGFGQGMSRTFIPYRQPTKKTADVRMIGDGYHITRIRKDKILLVHVDADHWKTLAHNRLSMPEDAAGATTIYHAVRNAHRKFAKHLAAEQKGEKQQPGKPPVIVWERIGRRANHWLDALCLGMAAGHFAGVRQIPTDQPAAAAERGEQTSWFAQQKKGRARA